MSSHVNVNDRTIDGRCSQCGECCSNILPMSQSEVETIKKYIKKHRIVEQRHNAMMATDMTCPFRDEANKRCTIYPVRPEICRQFMCNHTIEDIKRAKFDLNQKHKAVFMRAEFFKNEEDINFMYEFFKIMAGVPK